MTKETRIHEIRSGEPGVASLHLTFGFWASFGIRRSSFVKVILGNSWLPAGQFREWSHTRDGDSRRFPHPAPLPRGEGTARRAHWEAENSGLSTAPRMVRPLPEGEGRGEGKETVARACANVLARLGCHAVPEAALKCRFSKSLPLQLVFQSVF